ncbi:hypothetical protein J3F84DRAFT_389244 [Trichoderma pleuroticola]
MRLCAAMASSGQGTQGSSAGWFFLRPKKKRKMTPHSLLLASKGSIILSAAFAVLHRLARVRVRTQAFTLQVPATPALRSQFHACCPTLLQPVKAPLHVVVASVCLSVVVEAISYFMTQKRAHWLLCNHFHSLFLAIPPYLLMSAP